MRPAHVPSRTKGLEWVGLVLMAALLGSAWSAEMPEEAVSLVPDSLQAGDNFGVSLAAAKSRIVIGAHSDDTNGLDSGAVYVYGKSSSDDWSVVTKLFAQDARSGAGFGRSVAADNNTIIVGTYSQVSKNNVDSAAVYIFERLPTGTWQQVAKLSPKVALPEENFGVSLAISGGIVVVGANAEQSVESRSGAVYVFEQDSRGEWIQTARLTSSDKLMGDRFGSSVAIANSTLFVGATSAIGSINQNPDARAGAVYVYQLGPSGDWQQADKLTGFASAGGDKFGQSISADQNSLVIGAPGDPNGGAFKDAGAGYIFLRQGGNLWVEQQKIHPESPQNNANFGRSVAIYDGKVLVGARLQQASGSQRGAALVFKPDESGVWVQARQLETSSVKFGDAYADAVSLVDDMAIVGVSKSDGSRGTSPDSGAVLVFNTANYQEASQAPTPSISSSANQNRVTAHLKLRSDIATTKADDWDIYDNSPAGARITTVWDNELGAQVVELSGQGMGNGYRLGGASVELNGWNETSRFNLSWQMRTTDDFGVYIAVETAWGFRFLSYDARSKNAVPTKKGSYIFNGLGSESISGNWLTVNRDLSADLNTGEPGGNQILAVHGFYVRGNLRLHGIEFSETGSVSTPISADVNVSSRVSDSSAESVHTSSVDQGLKLFGNPVAAYGLANQLVGRAHATKSGTRQVAFAFVATTSAAVSSVRQYVIWSKKRAGYHGGTGGLVRIDIVTDENGSPSNNVMSSGTYRPDIGSNGHFNPVIMTGGQVTNGQKYWIKYTQIDSQPLVNWVSVNTLNQGLELSYQHGDTSGFRPHTVKRSDNSQAWVTSPHSGIYEVGYSNGVFQGNGYISSHAFNSKHYIGGVNRVRQKFIPNESMRVESVSVRAAKVHGRGELALRIRDAGNRELAQSYSKGFDSSASASQQAWVSFSVPGSVNLNAGQEYFLELEAPAGTLFFSYPSQSGDMYGFSLDTLGFSGEDMEKSGDSGRHWSGWKYDGRDDRKFQEMSAVVLYR